MSQISALETSYLNTLSQAEELGKRALGLSPNQVQEIRLLWELNAELLPQIYPRLHLLANLAKAIRTCTRYGELPDTNPEVQKYLASQLRQASYAIDKHNEFEMEEPIELPYFSTEEPESSSGAEEIELMALEEFQRFPNLRSIMLASLKSSLFGDPRVILRAFETWEAFIYVAPAASPGALLFTIMGSEKEDLSVADRNQIYIAADDMVQIELPQWSRKRNWETLQSWTEMVARLTGQPLGFRNIGVVSPISRAGIWIRALHLAGWNDPVMIQPI